MHNTNIRCIFTSSNNNKTKVMKTLTGSEKQVAYANGIIRRFNETIDLGLSKSSKPEHIEFLNNMKNHVNDIESAAEIISKSKNVPEEGSIPENISDLGMMMQNHFSKK